MHKVREAAHINAQHLLHLLNLPPLLPLTLNNQLLLLRQLPIEPVTFMFGLIPQSIILLAQKFDFRGENGFVLGWSLLAYSQNSGLFCGVHLGEEGGWGLAELGDLHLDGHALLGGHYAVQLHVVFVGHVVVEVVRDDGVGACLLEAEDQIDPLVEMR